MRRLSWAKEGEEAQAHQKIFTPAQLKRARSAPLESVPKNPLTSQLFLAARQYGDETAIGEFIVCALAHEAGGEGQDSRGEVYFPQTFPSLHQRSHQDYNTCGQGDFAGWCRAPGAIVALLRCGQMNAG